MQITVNETGAKTLTDARPMMIDGKNVYVVVDMDTASLMVGGRVVAERAVGGHMTCAAAQRWAVEYRATMNVVRDVTAAEVAEILKNAYASGLCVDMRHDNTGDYLALHDGAGIGYGHYRFA